MRIFYILLMLFGVPALAAEPNAAEAERLYLEMDRLASRNAWDGVERQYQQVVALGVRPDHKRLLLAAEAARLRGDVLSRVERLVDAAAAQPSAELQATIDDLLSTFGRVQITSDGVAPLHMQTLPFRPDSAAAVTYAQRVLADGQTFDGFLPPGDYSVGDRAVVVVAGQDMLVFSLLTEGQPTEDQALNDVRFPKKVTLAGTRLRLNGVGVREKIGIKVYLAALYLSEPTSDDQAAVRQDLPKRLVMQFVHRKVSAHVLANYFEQSFADMKGSASKQEEIARFLATMHDVVRGDELAFDYVPGDGLTVTLNGRERDTIEGTDFMWLVYAVFLGERPATKRLKLGLLGLDLRATLP